MSDSQNLTSYFKDELAAAVYYRTYSRFRYDLGRREHWPETVERVTNYLRESGGKAVTEDEYRDIHNSILNLEVLPSMRLMFMAGDAARRNNLAVYNCAYVVIDSIDSFVETLYCLMQGTGVGFSIEGYNVDKLPVILPIDSSYFSIPHYSVEDSTEGWADALRFGLHQWFSGKDVYFSFERVRPAGTPLRVKGGRSSGPQSLKNLLDFTRNIIINAAGRKLKPIECLDILTKTGEVVIVGGTRRSALISLSDVNDIEVRDAKRGPFWDSNPQRSLANNSAVYNSKPTWDTFQEEWQQLATSGSGERGIINRQASLLHAPERRKPILQEHRLTMGYNPCFAPDTLIQTRQGHFPIETLVGKTVEIWNGSCWQFVDNFRVTGMNQPLLKITMYDGSEEKVTPHHRVILEGGLRVEAQNLQIGQYLQPSNAPESHGAINENGAYLKGFLVGDGTSINKARAHMALYSTKYICENRLISSCIEVPVSVTKYTKGIESPGFSSESYQRRKVMQGLGLRQELYEWCSINKTTLPKCIYNWNENSKLEFIAGIMDADGTAADTSKGFMYQITSVRRQWLLDFQKLLLTVGVSSKLSLMRKSGRKDFNDGYGEYEAKDCWRLTISQLSAVKLSSKATFSRLVSFKNKITTYNLKSRRNKVMSIEQFGNADVVYCCTVAGSHSVSLTSGFLYGQCSEISLIPNETCNLSEVVLRPDDTVESISNKARIATIIGTIQSTLTNFPYIRKEWQEHCELERLLGVSVTGQSTCALWRNAEVMQQVKNVVLRTNEDLSYRLGINVSTATTTTKPSGSASLVASTSAGIHACYADYYIRRMRVSSIDPIAQLFKDQGVPWIPEVGQSVDNLSTYVFEFPCKSPEGSVTRNDLNAIQQLESWLLVKENWAEHSVSCTIYVEDDEWGIVGKWVYEHFDRITGLSFLPKSNHVYSAAPYEEITRDEYEKLSKDFPTVDYTLLHLYESSDTTEGAQTLACTGTNCEVS